MARRLFKSRSKSTDVAPPQFEYYHRRLSVEDIVMGRSQSSDPGMPSLPERPWRGNTTKPQQPPDLPTSRPPEAHSRRIPELPAEPSVPPRTHKNVPAGGPVGQMWYHSNMDRKKAETLLRHYSRDGTFIVRDSTKAVGEYSLSLWYGGGVRHLRIRSRQDGKFVLGEEKSDEHAFHSVPELIDSHRHTPIHLKSGGETVLKYECPH